MAWQGQFDVHQYVFSEIYKDLLYATFCGVVVRTYQRFPPFYIPRAIIQVHPYDDFYLFLQQIYGRVRNYCDSHGHSAEWIWKGMTMPAMDPTEYSRTTIFPCHPLPGWMAGQQRHFQITDVEIFGMEKDPRYPYEYMASIQVSSL